MTPWLHPPVGKRLRDLITKLGTVRELERQEILYPQGRKVSDIVLVQQGVTARNFGNAVSGPKAAAISTPGHFACGNLNFLTRRPSLGTYFALTKAQVVVCPKDLLLPVLSTDPELFAYTIRLLESCTLSDRVGFALMAFAPVDLRLKAFVVTWAIHYGKLSADGFIKCPIPLTRNNRCLVANASPVSTDNALKRWKEEGAWVRDGDFVTFPADFVDDAYQWMRSAEESSEYAYPNTFKELMEALPPLTNPWY